MIRYYSRALVLFVGGSLLWATAILSALEFVKMAAGQ
jgi:hypothetical protein